jgi:hypothetical protein
MHVVYVANTDRVLAKTERQGPAGVLWSTNLQVVYVANTDTVLAKTERQGPAGVLWSTNLRSSQWLQLQ